MNSLKIKIPISKIISIIVLSVLGLMAFIPLYWMVITACFERANFGHEISA